MHPSSFDKMAVFRRDYLESRLNEALVILDLDSQDINGSYRSLFNQSPWRYIGVDLSAGPNVDVVLRDPYDWRELSAASEDVVISGQTFEHTEFFWETMLQIARVLKTHGLCCILAPSSGPEHRYPLDCWRVYPDGLRAAAAWQQVARFRAYRAQAARDAYDAAETIGASLGGAPFSLDRDPR